MQLQGFPVQPKGLLERILQFRPGSTANQVNLQLTIQFNEQWVPLPSGRVKFGLKAGELKLKLENGKIPRSSRELSGSLQLSQQDQIRAGTVQSDATGPIESMTKEAPGESLYFSVCQVTTKGSEENPAWVFQAETGQPVLKGLIKNARLGTLNVSANPCRVAATFEVSLRDVRLTEAEGLWPPDISPNKRAVLERAIALHLLKSRLTPYLSRAELHYD